MAVGFFPLRAWTRENIYWKNLELVVVFRCGTKCFLNGGQARPSMFCTK